MSDIITLGAGVLVSMTNEEESPAFIVSIPDFGCRIYGGWNWGPHNPQDPSIIETLVGAKQVLIGSFNDNIYKFDKNKDQQGAIDRIDFAISNVLGKTKVIEKN